MSPGLLTLGKNHGDGSNMVNQHGPANNTSSFLVKNVKPSVLGGINMDQHAWAISKWRRQHHSSMDLLQNTLFQQNRRYLKASCFVGFLWFPCPSSPSDPSDAFLYLYIYISARCWSPGPYHPSCQSTSGTERRKNMTFPHWCDICDHETNLTS